MGRQKRMDALWEKLDREHAFFIFNIDTENEDPNCMTTEGPHRSATPLGGKQRRAAPMRGRGIEGSPESSDGKSGLEQVKEIVKDIIKDIVEDIIEDVTDGLVCPKLKERDAEIKGMLEAKADQDELKEELAATRRMLEEQRRQLAVIIDWIRGV
ncbi:hypothetical protein UCDDA912_g01066 [Diaporthe ampelina]|uniref:Uncharacterized protein n=1 Tax=Diaporthe ampelina TaxID=1214573 RepID=A0A0G2FY10_9PEZI|nr:hypothetical protein UCDDA912_g01066 [Diaporthe ampelina]